MPKNDNINGILDICGSIVTLATLSTFLTSPQSSGIIQPLSGYDLFLIATEAAIQEDNIKEEPLTPIGSPDPEPEKIKGKWREGRKRIDGAPDPSLPYARLSVDTLNNLP